MVRRYQDKDQRYSPAAATRMAVIEAPTANSPGRELRKLFTPLDFRSYAARSSQARRMTLISSDVGWLVRDALNLATIRTRRSLEAMSAVDGWTFVLYQGARARRASMSAGW